VPDGATCKTLIDGITQHGLSLPKAMDSSFNDHARTALGNQYEKAAMCVAAASGKCADGVAVLESQCVMVPMAPAACKAAAANSWKVTMQYARPPLACH
jgi:hypothetical protein